MAVNITTYSLAVVTACGGIQAQVLVLIIGTGRNGV